MAMARLLRYAMQMLWSAEMRLQRYQVPGSKTVPSGGGRKSANEVYPCSLNAYWERVRSADSEVV